MSANAKSAFAEINDPRVRAAAEALAAAGWVVTPLQLGQSGPFAIKQYVTAVGEKSASVFIRPADLPDADTCLQASYFSEGRDILTTTNLFMPVNASAQDASSLTGKLAGQIDTAVDASYARKLHINHGLTNQPLVMPTGLTVNTEPDIDYDLEDFGLNAEELVAKYGDQGHPFHTIDAWRTGPSEQAEFNGYWDWVTAQIAADDDSWPADEEEAPATAPVDSPRLG